MRLTCLSGLAAVVALALPALASAQESPMPGCIEPPPCVYVSPDLEPKLELGTVYVFYGQGWRPRGRVKATFTEFCSLDAYCDNNLVRRRFRADSKGRFTFRLLFDFRRARLPAPSGIGGDHNDATLVDFSQERRRRGKVRTIWRDAIGIPPPSTPEQRAEAAALGAAAARASRALEKRELPALRALDRQFRREKRTCGNVVGLWAPPRAVRVDTAVSLHWQDRTKFRVVRAELEAFAAELERLTLTDPALRAGADAWVAAIRRPGRWPLDDACTLLRRWKATGWARDKRPIDPRATVDALFEFEIGGSKTLDAAEARMRALAAGKTNAERFGGGLYEPSDFSGIFG